MSDTGLGNAFLDLELDVEVWLASERVPLHRLIELHPGELLELDHDPDGPVDLVVNGTVVAGGELVIVDGRFGFRVTRTAQQQLAELESRLPTEVQAAPAAGGPADGSADRVADGVAEGTAEGTAERTAEEAATDSPADEEETS